VGTFLEKELVVAWESSRKYGDEEREGREAIVRM
jgi:hypothetical protein